MPPPILSTTDPKSISETLRTLKDGGVVLIPTETVYGICADSERKDAIDRLYEIKGRPKIKPFQWMVHHSEVAKKLSTEWGLATERLTQRFWPGPLTLVIPTATDTVGWRIPKHDWLLKLLEELGRPLIVTSANISAQPPALTCEEGIQSLGEKINLAIDGGKASLGEASTVVKISSDKTEILRCGALSQEQIFGALKDD
jgi:L-threonylcarbamoyladenylate synthase